MSMKILLLKVLVLLTLTASAQPAADPENYFRNPLGIPIDLSANFGELRSDHWHMGLDIRTNQKENLPVYAAAEGYIAEIGIRPQSFGRFIIIHHPNGLSTLYAHLNDFYPELESYVEEQQYKLESWAVELQVEPGRFPVRKGQFFAYSGNTGGSQGPHLHFEIFDTKSGRRLNPLLFNFGVKDEVAPSITKLAMYDRSRSIYEQSPVLFSLKKKEEGYVLSKDGIIQTGLNKVSFAIQAYDRVSGSSNPNGIYSAKIYVDESPLAGFVLDSIDYDGSLYINAHIDYRYKANGGPYLQHIARLPGDHGTAFRSYGGDGVLMLGDQEVHRIDIEVKDPAGNASYINFRVQYLDSLAALLPPREKKEMALPGTEFILSKPGFEARLAPGALYDMLQPLYFRSEGKQPGAVSDFHQFNDATVPIHRDVEVRIRPDKDIPGSWKDHLLMQRTGRGSTIRKVELVNGWATARFGELGKFQLLADIIPPSINSPGKGDTINLSAASRIIFSPTDNFGIVKIFRAELDGSWLRFTNDKSRNWIYKFDERWSYGVHELTVTVEDHAGNLTRRSWWIKRHPYTPPPPKKKTKKKSKR
jgi:hypothetical protein